MKKIVAVILLIMVAILVPVILYNKPEQRINELQVIGSHNSYKEYIDSALLVLIKKEDSNAVKALEYTNASLADQLTLGLRALEIDVYADPKGGMFAQPGGLSWAPVDTARPYDAGRLMMEPGFKVFHMPDIDFRSNCLTLKSCLQQLSSWSSQHPGHEPVFITINAKDDTVARLGFTQPVKFTPEHFNALDEFIAGQLGPGKIITPDQVKGNYETLEKAVLAKNWPTLKDASGKFIFILDEDGEKKTMYTRDHPSLFKRTLFVNSPPGNPESAILILNDPLKDSGRIKMLVKKGYIIRTRADADTKEARMNDKRRFLAACNSGAQVISTDYYQRSSLFNSPYQVSFNEGKFVRKNPVLNP